MVRKIGEDIPNFGRLPLIYSFYHVILYSFLNEGKVKY